MQEDARHLISVDLANSEFRGSVVNLRGKVQRHYFGDGFGAGEIGHVVAIEEGERCRCGHYGCLETVSSNRAVVKRACAIAEQSLDSLLCQFASTSAEMSADAVLQAFEAGEEALAAETQVGISGLGRES